MELGCHLSPSHVSERTLGPGRVHQEGPGKQRGRQALGRNLPGFKGNVVKGAAGDRSGLGRPPKAPKEAWPEALKEALKEARANSHSASTFKPLCGVSGRTRVCARARGGGGGKGPGPPRDPRALRVQGTGRSGPECTRGGGVAAPADYPCTPAARYF